MNHQHVIDFFPNSKNPTLEQINHFGVFLKQIWECKLKSDFPERDIAVEYLQGENFENDIYDFELVIYHNR